MASYFKAILLLIVLVVLVTFGIQNNETVKLYYYFGMNSMPMPVYGIVYASILVGIFIGMLIGISTRFSQHKKIKVLEKENRKLQEKVGAEQKPQEEKEETPLIESQLDETLEVKDESEN
jgi:uncharacterized integral membrane protein